MNTLWWCLRNFDEFLAECHLPQCHHATSEKVQLQLCDRTFWTATSVDLDAAAGADAALQYLQLQAASGSFRSSHEFNEVE